jgi:hypothetical protein
MMSMFRAFGASAILARLVIFTALLAAWVVVCGP